VIEIAAVHVHVDQARQDELSMQVDVLIRAANTCAIERYVHDPPVADAKATFDESARYAEPTVMQREVMLCHDDDLLGLRRSGITQRARPAPMSATLRQRTPVSGWHELHGIVNLEENCFPAEKVGTPSRAGSQLFSRKFRHDAQPRRAQRVPARNR
jgi:hypothetical protein